MATIETVYEGGLRTRARHLASGEELITDAPPDNHGRGEGFSPTDLLSASLGSCMLTIMGIAANAHHLDIDGARLTITKIMSNQPRKVAEIKMDFYMPAHSYDEHQRLVLERAARTCPVALSLHPELIQSINFHW